MSYERTDRYRTSYPRTNRYNGGQDRPARQARPASLKQMATIERCVSGDLQKIIAEDVVAKIAEMTAAGMTGDQASKWITWLFKQPFANRKGGAPAQAQARAEAPSVSTEGIYRFTDGSVYRVVESKRNPGRFVAKMVTAHGWEWAKGMIFKLTAEMRMTPEQIAEFGIRTQVCAQCSRGLEDPISKKIGLGTKCGPAILGGDEYKAARKAAALDPQVAEQLAAIKAGKAAAPAPVAQAYVQVRDLDIADDNQAEAELANRDWAEWKNEFAKREAEQERAAEEAKFAWKQANERF